MPPVVVGADAFGTVDPTVADVPVPDGPPAVHADAIAPAARRQRIDRTARGTRKPYETENLTDLDRVTGTEKTFFPPDATTRPFMRSTTRVPAGADTVTFQNLPTRTTFVIRGAPDPDVLARTGSAGAGTPADGAGDAAGVSFCDGAGAGAGAGAAAVSSAGTGTAAAISSATAVVRLLRTRSPPPSNTFNDDDVVPARKSSRFAVVESTPESLFALASARRRSATCAGVSARELPSTAAAAPATCGLAMEVPLSVAVAVDDDHHADTIDEPGANRSTQLP